VTDLGAPTPLNATTIMVATIAVITTTPTTRVITRGR
jgi:hypothetical protein